MLRIPVNGSGSPTSLGMARRGLRSGVGSVRRIPNGFERISIRFRPDCRLANSGRPGSAPLPSSDRSENKSFGDNAQGCRLTILSCVAEWSRPECDAADSGRPPDQVEPRTTRPAWNSTRSPRTSASILEQREFHAPLDGLDRIATRRTMVDFTSGQCREARTGRMTNPLATMRKGIIRPFSHVS